MKRRDMLIASPLAALAGCSGNDGNPLADTGPAPDGAQRAGIIPGAPEGVVEITDEMKRNVSKMAADWGEVPDPDPLAHIVVKDYVTTYELNFTKYDFGQLRLKGHAKHFGSQDKVVSQDIGGVLILDKYLGFSGKDPSYGQLFAAAINLEDTDSGDMIVGHPQSNSSAIYVYQKITIHREIIVMLMEQAIEKLYG